MILCETFESWCLCGRIGLFGVDSFIIFKEDLSDILNRSIDRSVSKI